MVRPLGVLLLTVLALLSGCSSSTYATKEDLARLEGRVQSLEQRSGGSSSGGMSGGQGGMGGGQGGMGGGQGGMGGGQGGMGGGQGGMGGEGGQAGMGGGQGGQGGEGGQQVSAEAQAAEQALAAGMDAMNKGDIEGAKAKLNEVATTYPDQKGAELAKNILAELEILGANAPALSTESWLQGKGDLNAGKATLLMFFTIENKNAENALGRVQSLASGAKSRGLNVIGITQTSEISTSDKIGAFLTSKGVSFPVALDKDRATASAYKRSAPISAVLIKGGKVVWTGNASRMSDDILNKYL